MAAAYAALYPLPNRPGTERQLLHEPAAARTTTTPCIGRVDHNFNVGQPAVRDGLLQQAAEDRYNWAQDASNATDGGVINGFPVTQGFDYRQQHRRDRRLHVGAVVDALLLDVRVSCTRFGEWRDPAQDFDPATLGLLVDGASG